MRAMNPRHDLQKNGPTGVPLLEAVWLQEWKLYMSNEKPLNGEHYDNRGDTKPPPGSAQEVYQALCELSAFAEEEVAIGGVDLQNDPEWEEGVLSVLDRHAVWGPTVGLPPPPDGPEWETTLVRWATNLPYANASMAQVAAWICHASLVRDLHDWTKAVSCVCDRYWPPNLRPHNMETKELTWSAAAGDTVDDRWIVDLSAGFVRMFPKGRKRWAVPSMYQRGDDMVGALPGLITVAWLHESWRWGDYERHIDTVLEGAS